MTSLTYNAFPMFNLILDTSTEKGIVLIAEGHKIKFAAPLVLKAVKGSALLVGSVTQGFETLAISASDLKTIAVAIGPGSFTGIRVAASFAKGLAMGIDVPLIGFSSLLGYVNYEEGPFVSLIPTKMGGSYVMERLCQNGEIKELSEAKFVPQDQCLFEKIISPAESFPCQNFLAKTIEKKFLEKKFSQTAELEMSYLNPSLW